MRARFSVAPCSVVPFFYVTVSTFIHLYITLKIEASGRIRHAHMLLLPQNSASRTVDLLIQYRVL
jgi:hypothetical protein